jgi:uncharacterized protein YggE
MKSGITVTGRGEASIPPDEAYINLAASAVRPDPGTAIAEVSARVKDLLAVMEQNGVPQRDVQTVELNLWPETDRDGAPRGYRARNGVRIRISEIAAVGELIGKALGVLGESAEMGGVSFGRGDLDSAEARARETAWHNVSRKAEQLARLAGLTLGRPLAIEESGPLPGPRPMARMAMAEAIPVEPGSTAVAVVLSVRFALVG